MSGDASQMDRDEASAALGHLLDAAARRLVGLEQPVVVAACPMKHDDTGHYPDWLGVQVGRATWERSDYGEDGGDVLENARNPDALPIAREVLGWLQEAAWREVTERALGLALGNDVVAIVVQHGATWFVVSASNWGEDVVFLLGPEGSLLQVGKAERLDQRLGRPRPLLLERIEPAAWPDLHAAAPAFPIRRQEVPTAAGLPGTSIRLAGLLDDAVLALREVPGTLRYAAAGDRNPDDGQFVIPAWRAIALDAFRVWRTDLGDVARYKARIKEYGAAAEAMDRTLDALEAAKWRALFSESVMPLAPDDPLALLVRGDGAWLIAGQTAVFAFDRSGRLDLVGACDRIGLGLDVEGVAIHLFDGRSLTTPRAY